MKRKCILCGSSNWLEKNPHHSFYRSEYFEEDRDEEWNLIRDICKNCHFDIHHRGNKKKQMVCKMIALERYNGEHRDKLLKIMKQKQFYERSIAQK